MSFICLATDIDEGTTKGFSINEQSFFAVKRDANIYVYKNSCPHLGVELEWVEDQFLDAEGALIQCATHGALFIIETGECVAGPCLRQSLEPVNFEVRDGALYLIDYC